jgi:hypothetical protein
VLLVLPNRSPGCAARSYLNVPPRPPRLSDVIAQVGLNGCAAHLPQCGGSGDCSAMEAVFTWPRLRRSILILDMLTLICARRRSWRIRWLGRQAEDEDKKIVRTSWPAGHHPVRRETDLSVRRRVRTINIVVKTRESSLNTAS